MYGNYLLRAGINENTRTLGKNATILPDESVYRLLLEKSRTYMAILCKPKDAAPPTPEGPDLERLIEEFITRLAECERKIRDFEERLQRLYLNYGGTNLDQPPPRYEDCVRRRAPR